MGAGLVAAPSFRDIAGPWSDSHVRFGVIANVQHGSAEDAQDRLREFVEAAHGRELDFVIQMGDFNHDCPSLWRLCRVPRYAVLGDHDMNLGTKADATGSWNIPHRYYSFDVKGLHSVVLDANNIFENGEFVPYENANFYRDPSVISHIDDEQFDWLAKDLETTLKQTVVFVHQPIDEGRSGDSCQNRHRARAVLEEANRRAGWNKVAACFQGHCQEGGYELRRGVCYLRIYERPLFGFVTVEEGRIRIDGSRGRWATVGLQEQGVPGSRCSAPETGSLHLKLR